MRRTATDRPAAISPQPLRRPGVPAFSPAFSPAPSQTPQIRYADGHPDGRRAGLRRINLALQGGGAHGAFTWGVLDRLLELNAYDIDGISGTSAGAVNAVALAAGYMEAGPDGARRKLEDVWRAVSAAQGFAAGRPGGMQSLDFEHAEAPQPGATPAHLFLSAVSRVFSPYEFNPLEIDPLRAILADLIDFDGLRRNPPVQLFINATEARSGRGRVFSGAEISLDVVLASACLPALRHAVKIGGRYYWDGGYSSNPPLFPLIEHCAAADTMIVRLTPTPAGDVPTGARDIQGNVNRIMFSQPLRKEIEMIETMRRMVCDVEGPRQGLERRVHEHRFHLLDGSRYTGELHPESHLQPHWDVLSYLNQSGRTATTNWLRRHRKSLGDKSTVDLAKRFL